MSPVKQREGLVRALEVQIEVRGQRGTETITRKVAVATGRGRGLTKVCNRICKTPITATKQHRRLLEAAFWENQKPTSVERANICKYTGLTMQQVYQWFYNQRKILTRPEHRETATVNTHHFQSASVSRLNAESSEKGVTSGQTGANQPRPRYLWDTRLRINDHETIVQDLENIKNGDISEMDAILLTWEEKARRLLRLAKIKELRPNILKECQRLKRLLNNSRILSLFSEEQNAKIDTWKSQFVSSIRQQERKSLRQTVTEIKKFVCPWLRPYIYSKLTKQDGRYLVLATGVMDFERFVNAGTSANAKLAAAATSKWTVPLLMNCRLFQEE